MGAYINTKLGEIDIDELQYDIIIDGQHHLAWLDEDGEFIQFNDGDGTTYTKEEIIGNHYECFAGVWRETGFVYVCKLGNEGSFEPLKRESI